MVRQSAWQAGNHSVTQHISSPEQIACATWLQIKPCTVGIPLPPPTPQCLRFCRLHATILGVEAVNRLEAVMSALRDSLPSSAPNPCVDQAVQFHRDPLPLPPAPLPQAILLHADLESVVFREGRGDVVDGDEAALGAAEHPPAACVQLHLHSVFQFRPPVVPQPPSRSSHPTLVRLAT